MRKLALLLVLLSQSLEPLLLGQLGIFAAHPNLGTFARPVRRASRATRFFVRVMTRRAVERGRAAEHEPEPNEPCGTTVQAGRPEQVAPQKLFCTSSRT